VRELLTLDGCLDECELWSLSNIARDAKILGGEKRLIVV
jgi:hypothetical protein